VEVALDRIVEILKDVRPECAFEKSGDFITDGMLDSFDVVTLVSALDQAFSISIEGTEIVPENFKNIETIRALLRKYGVGV
jgi:acyl carrier protein